MLGSQVVKIVSAIFGEMNAARALDVELFQSLRQRGETAGRQSRCRGLGARGAIGNARQKASFFFFIDARGVQFSWRFPASQESAAQR